MSITFYRGINRNKFDTASGPTMEAAAGRDSLSQIIAESGVVSDLTDGKRQTLLTAELLFPTGDDASFASDTGNWDLTDSGLSISIGLQFTSVAAGDSASITLPLAAVAYTVKFTMNAGANGIRAVVGGTPGTTRTGSTTYTETIIGGGTTTFQFQAQTGATTRTITDFSITLATDFHVDDPFDQRVDVDTLILDNTDIWDALPTAPTEAVVVSSYSSDTFGSSSPVALTKNYGGLLGRKRPYLDFDGLSDYVSVSDSAQLDWGNGDGSIEAWFTLNNVDSDQYIFSRFSNATNRCDLTYQSNLLQFILTVGGTQVIYATTSWAPSAGQRYRICIYFKNSNTSGTAIYIDGVAQTLVNNNSNAGNVALSHDLEFARLDSGPTYYPVEISLIRWWNRTLSAAQAIDLNQGGALPDADKWGSQNELSSGFMTVGKRYKISARTGADFTLDGAADNNVGTEFIATNNSQGLDANDKVYAIGCVAMWRPEGINSSDDIWYDASTHSLDGTITGADAKFTPNGTDRGFLLYQFVTTNARYWYVDINSGDITPNASIHMGQLTLGSSFQPMASPNLNQSFGAGIGAVTRTSYGGHKYVTKRHVGRYGRTMAWDFLTEADKLSFEALFADIEVSEDGPSLFPLYYADQDLPTTDAILHCARIIGKPEFSEVAHKAYALSLVLEDEV